VRVVLSDGVSTVPLDSKIYTIRCKTNKFFVYVGSTCQSLDKRWDNHKQNSKQKISKGRLLFKTIADNSGFTNFYIELHENYPCNNKEELLKREGEDTREIGNMNSQIPGRTSKQWYLDNRDIRLAKNHEYYINNLGDFKEKSKKYREETKEHKKEHDKEYYEKNKESILKRQATPVVCECGCTINHNKLSRHKKTKKHIDLMNDITQ
jgi:hypothetical protein